MAAVSRTGIVKATVGGAESRKPHPPVFQPFVSSERRLDGARRKSMSPPRPPLHPTLESQLRTSMPKLSASRAARGWALRGRRRSPTADDEARQLWRDSGYFCGHHWFGSIRILARTGRIWGDWQRSQRGLAFVGTVDTVTAPVRDDGEASAGAMDLRLDIQQPVAAVILWLMKTIELFWTKVLPRVANMD